MPRKAAHGYREDPVIRSMRVRTWYRAVTLASKMTAQELEREFSELSHGVSAPPRSCIWDKYRRGEVAPRSGVRADGQPNLVVRVEDQWPGTAQWLSSPLWRLVDKAPMEMSEIRGVFGELPGDYRQIFIAFDKPTGLFWRRRVDPKRVCQVLEATNSINAFIALLALAKEAEIAQDQDQHMDAVASVEANLHSPSMEKVLGQTIRDEVGRYLAKRWTDPGYFGRQ